MLTVLTIVTPVFALMGFGFIAAKWNVLPAGSGGALAQFSFKIAMPALLFRAMLNAGTLADSPFRLLAAYFLATLCIWTIASFSAAFLLNRPREDHAVFAMGSSFGNTVMLGVPIAITAFGQEAAAPLALLVAVETPLLWIIATLHIEVAKRGRAISLGALGGVAKDLSSNTIVISLVLGLAGKTMGLTLPDVPDRIVAMLGQAAVPTALFAMGMTLAGFRISGEGRAVGMLAGLKIGLYPFLAYFMAAHVFSLPPLWVAIVVLQAAMPVGANAFLFASRYDRSAGTVSAAIAVSTLTAVVTVSLVLMFLSANIVR